MDHIVSIGPHREPWNKGKLVGVKAPLKLKDVWGYPSASTDLRPDA